MIYQEVIHERKPAFPANHWPPFPVKVVCQYCGHDTKTKVDENTGALAWILCLVLTLVGCILGCCLIPFCCKSCNDHEHKCSHCKKTLGFHKSCG